MRVKYVGPHDEVEIYADYGHAVCKRGATVEVGDDFGKRLLEQKANWQPVRPEPKTQPKEK